jgi:hypothetical protein
MEHPMNVKKMKQPKLTRQVICAKAVKIADTDGIEMLSMRRLAQSLNVEAMSLYHHVSSKSDLIAGMIEIVTPEIELPSKDIEWKDAMRKRANSMKVVLEQHTWATQLFLSGVNDGPRMLKYVDSTVGYLLQAGFSHVLTDYAWNIIDSYIYGFTIQKQNFPFKPSEYQKVATQYLPHLSHEDFPHVYSMTAKVADGSHAGIQDFDFGLNLILEGLDKFRVDNEEHNNLIGE